MNNSLARIRLILSHPSHPGNIGACARAMKTMGLFKLYLVNPKKFPDPEANARAAGADDVLQNAMIVNSLQEALEGVVFAAAVTARHRNLAPAPLLANAAAKELIEKSVHGEIALVFGNETSGLSNDEVQACQRTIHIPANPDYSSLNLGSAVQILCYEIYKEALFTEGKSASIIEAPFSPLAKFEEIEGLYTHLQCAMIKSGFLDPQEPKRLMAKLRRLFGRIQLEKDEINILRGVLDALEKQKLSQTRGFID